MEKNNGKLTFGKQSRSKRGGHCYALLAFSMTKKTLLERFACCVYLFLPLAIRALFTQGHLRVKTTKYYIGSAFHLDGDSVFGA